MDGEMAVHHALRRGLRDVPPVMGLVDCVSARSTSRPWHTTNGPGWNWWGASRREATGVEWEGHGMDERVDFWAGVMR